MTKIPQTLTNVLERLELEDVIFPDHEWVGTTRASLYRAAITALAECAVNEGFKVTIETADDGYPVCEVADTADDEYETDPCTICEGSGTLEDGSICQFCAGYGNRIIDDENPAALMPDDPESR